MKKKDAALFGTTGPELVNLPRSRKVRHIDLSALVLDETIAMNGRALTDDQHHDLPAPLWVIGIEGDLILLSDRVRGRTRCWRIIGRLDPGQDNARLNDFKSVTFNAVAATAV